MVSEMRWQREKGIAAESHASLETREKRAAGSSFTRPENHVTMQLYVRARLYALPMCSVYLRGGHGCINLCCLRICGRTIPPRGVRKKGTRTNGKHLSLADTSLPNIAARAAVDISLQKKIRIFAEISYFLYTSLRDEPIGILADLPSAKLQSRKKLATKSKLKE